MYPTKQGRCPSAVEISQYLPSFGGVRTFYHHQSQYRDWIRKSFPGRIDSVKINPSLLMLREWPGHIMMDIILSADNPNGFPYKDGYYSYIGEAEAMAGLSSRRQPALPQVFIIFPFTMSTGIFIINLTIKCPDKLVVKFTIF